MLFTLSMFAKRRSGSVLGSEAFVRACKSDQLLPALSNLCLPPAAVCASPTERGDISHRRDAPTSTSTGLQRRSEGPLRTLPPAGVGGQVDLKIKTQTHTRVFCFASPGRSRVPPEKLIKSTSRRRRGEIQPWGRAHAAALRRSAAPQL